MTNITVKVNTEVLMQTANSFQQEGSAISRITAQMMALVNELSNQWAGDASTAYISKFRMLEDDIYRMSNKISEFVEDLTSISNVYNTFETDSMDIVSGLETDVIF